MLWAALALLISGIMLVSGGRRAGREAAACTDLEERTALERVSRRRRAWGTVEIIVGAIIGVPSLAIALIAVIGSF